MIFMKKLIAIFLILSLFASLCICAEGAEVKLYETAADVGFAPTGLDSGLSAPEVIDMYPEAAEYIAEELKDYRNHIDGTPINVSKYGIDTTYGSDLFMAVVIENPDLFYVPTSPSYTGYVNSTTILRYNPSYLFSDADELDAAVEEVEESVDYYLSGVEESWTDIQKARYLHDMIATQCSYAPLPSDNEMIYTAYGVLAERSAVCQGYSLAYELLLDRVGIESTMISSSSMNHAWNMVKLDGNYYHTDVTWDDPTADNLGRAQHSYFMLSESAFASDGKHYGWEGNLEANDTTYDNAWWKDVDAAIYIIDGDEYYIKKDGYLGTLTKRNDAGEEEVLSANTSFWNVYGNPYSYYTSSYSFLSCYGGYLYYNDRDNIYKVAPDSDAPETVFERNTDYYIYGFNITPDGNLNYTVKEKPSDENDIYSIELPNELEELTSLPVNVDDEDTNFEKFKLAKTDNYTGNTILGVQRMSQGRNGMRFVAMLSSTVLKNAKEYGYVLSKTSKTTQEAKENSEILTVDNGYKLDCTGTSNSMTDGYGTSDLSGTKYKYMLAAVNNITDDNAVVARFYVIDKNNVPHYGIYIDSNGDTWNGCAARLSELDK